MQAATRFKQVEFVILRRPYNENVAQRPVALFKKQSCFAVKLPELRREVAALEQDP